MSIRLRHRGLRAVGVLVVAGVLAGCAVAPRDETPAFSTERHYELACESASIDIDTLLVHWENIRSSERMSALQMMRAREAMRVIAPVCANVAAVHTLDSVAQSRVQSAFRTIEQAARNLPRLPAGG